MTEPLDLAAIRALADKCWKGPGVYPFGGEKIIALCDEIERLREYVLDLEAGHERLRAEKEGPE